MRIRLLGLATDPFDLFMNNPKKLYILGDPKKLHERDHSWLPEMKSYCQMLSITVKLKAWLSFEMLHDHFEQLLPSDTTQIPHFE